MWPFRRKPKHVGPSTVAWRPGDMAECIDDDWASDFTGDAPQGKFPVVGTRAMVMSTRIARGSIFLRLGGFPSGWNATAFRKIVLTDTGADRTVSADKPRRVREPT